MFVMDYYGHKLSNGVLFAYHLVLDVPGGSPHLRYFLRAPLGRYPATRVNPRMGIVPRGNTAAVAEVRRAAWDV